MTLNDIVKKVREIQDKEWTEEEIENCFKCIENGFSELCSRKVFDNVVELVKKNKTES